MLRSAFLTSTLLAALSLSAAAQVVSNGGYATTAPNGAPSVPAITTPTAHVGPEATPEAAPGYSGSAVVDVPQEVVQRPATDQVQNQGATPSAQPAVQQPFNFGVAQYESGVSAGDMGQPLGEVAKAMRQRAQAANAKTFTNADIERMDSSSGKVSGVPQGANDQWPENNGVITSGPANNQQPPAPNANPAASGSPFTPRENNPSPAENSAPPQAYAKPSAAQPYMMAQTHPANAGIAQNGDTGNGAATSTSNDQNANDQNANLPKTASKLPLLGVLGFFSVTMGMFVRHQRAKAR